LHPGRGRKRNRNLKASANVRHHRRGFAQQRRPDPDRGRPAAGIPGL
jgi:hypothetical protein